MNGWNDWLGAAAALGAGILGAMGLGGGGVLLLWLNLTGMDQRQAQGLNLLFILPVGLAALWFHRKNGLIQWSLLPWLLAGGAAGVLAGHSVAGLLPEEALRKGFGLLLVITALGELKTARRLLHRQGEEKKNGEQS
nr:sulfite exporter TauE/SafE family protein [Angelakisella massiliensis]